MSKEVLAAQLDNVLADATIPELPNHYRGKVRDNYDLADGRRIIVATDRLSAFDRILTAIPCKGQVLTQIARFWFDETRDICPNHVIEYPDPNVVVCRRLDILPVEIVVRDYLTGTTGTSIWPMYRAGRREIYGIRFPDGLRENQKLPATIITPTTKAAEGEHDEPVTPDQIVARGLLTARAVAKCLRAGAGAVRARSRHRRRTRSDPRRHQIRIRCLTETDGSSSPMKFTRRTAAGIGLATPTTAASQAGEPPDTLDKDYLRRWVSARCDPYRDPIPEIPSDVILETARIYIDALRNNYREDF